MSAPAESGGWRVCRVRAELPAPASSLPALAALPGDWGAWLSEADIPVGTPFLVSPEFDYDVSLNAFFGSAEMLGAPMTTQLG